MNLLFFDIDGTLTDEKTGTIPQSTLEALKQTQEAGNLVFINTGRVYCSIPPILEQFPFDGYVCGCGTYVRVHDKVIHHRKLSNELCRQIALKSEETKCFAIFEGADTLYYDYNLKDDPRISITDHPESGFKPGLDLHDVNIVFDKFTLWHTDYSDFSAFLQTFKDELDFIERNKDFGEFVPKGYTKATGIKLLMDHFNVDLDHVYCFGDSANDLGMLNYCKHSIVVASGNPEIFDAVEFITKEVDHDGIAFALKHYHLI